VCVRPHAACTNLVPAGALRAEGVMCLGAFSETSPNELEGLPRAGGIFLPKHHASPSMSMATKWQEQADEWIETTLISLSERRMYGSSKSGL
jgi:hypothetical protein